MDIIDFIRNAESAPRVLAALSVYVESLRQVSAIPEWLLRLPLRDANDVAQRMTALLAVVHLTSQNLLVQECRAAKRALQVFAAATWRLRANERKDPR
jgi:hypothetical protein